MTEKPPYSSMSAFERSHQIGHAMAALDITTRLVNGLESMFRRAASSTQGNIYAAQAPTHAGKTTAQKVFMLLKAQELGGYTENVKKGVDDFDAMPDVSYVTIRAPDGKLTHPVVRIHIQANPTIKALVKHVARALTRGAADLPDFNVRDMQAGNLNDVTAFFTAAVRKSDARLIIFDEMQEIGKVVGAHRNGAVNVIKALCKSGHAQLACVGIEGTLDVLNFDGQVADLVTKRHIFRPLPEPVWEGEKSDVATAEFIEFLRAMEVQLPFDEPSDLTCRDVAEPLWKYSRGVVGVAKTLLMEATDYAIHRDIRCLDRDVFKDVCTYELDLDDELNPFVVPDANVGDDEAGVSP